jgi:hypothetical protein
MYIIYVYESRTIKPIELILSLRERDKGEWWWE